MLALFQQGIEIVFTFQVLGLIFFGTVVGIIFGAIPGLTATMAVALFLPITYSLSATSGIALLVGLYIGGVSGGLISAILLKIPGTPASVATTFDGGPMMEKGEGAKALGVGIFYSFLGTFVSILALIFIAPTLAKIALSFGPHEYFSIAIFSLTLIITLSTGSMVKGIFSGAFGFMFSTVGIAPVDAITRFTFGRIELNSGFDILPVLIGLFAISEIIKVAEEVKSEQHAQIQVVKLKGFGFSLKEFFEQGWNCIRSILIGTGIGILPGIGSGTSNIVAYMVAKKQSKNPEKFGTGCIDGIVASEAASCSAVGGAMIPLLTLGIPGDTVTAMLLGGFMIHGIQPGPLLFMSQGPLVYSIFIAMIVSAVFMLICELYGVRIFVKMLAIPKHILLPIILVLCVVGAFGLGNRIFDVGTIVFFGLVGYAFVKCKIPQTPFIIGLILGPMAETNLRRGLMLSDGNFMGFLTEPISAGFLAVAVASVVLHIYKTHAARRKQRAASLA
ncbi:tripartite tricarboxylate transporter permease [Uliginosibacterium sp. TH139]|uniref:tripartite tricarboxylate transporter permease n=1 Tax=Uliginosibacterium sp. TH139 TaxID=2067453 RepID=UPI000C7C8FD3|nr:tripartite tricarboxylate transporter permease [Uliginosibacterium sp. TH139]PLK50345.1 Tat pathway signal protein [Uliginosibacterium sp. TH139]